jgi:hypothetical protein
MKTLTVILTLALAMMVFGQAMANSNIELPRWVVGSGATDANAGNVTVRATLGQPIMGAVSGGEVTLWQGFWHGLKQGIKVYLPLVLRDSQP